jgi:hypothetical protein
MLERATNSMIGTKQFLRALSTGALLILCFAAFSCSANNENSHTTATTYVSPPSHQVLTVVPKPATEAAKKGTPTSLEPNTTSTEPSLAFALEQKSFHIGEAVPIEFSVTNAKLKDDGGEFRVRYIIDDEEMKWVDTAGPFWLSGWTPGKHTIRLELIRPDGWPCRNNVVTREIEIK